MDKMYFAFLITDIVPINEKKIVQYSQLAYQSDLQILVLTLAYFQINWRSWNYGFLVVML